MEEIRSNRELRDGKGRVGISWDTGCRNLPGVLGDYAGTNLLISQVEKLRPREGWDQPWVQSPWESSYRRGGMNDPMWVG